MAVRVQFPPQSQVLSKAEETPIVSHFSRRQFIRGSLAFAITAGIQPPRSVGGGRGNRAGQVAQFYS